MSARDEYFIPSLHDMRASLPALTRDDVIHYLQQAKDAERAAAALVATLERHLLHMKEGAAPPPAAPR